MVTLLMQLLPILVPFGVSLVRKVVPQIPSKWIPTATALGGAMIGLSNAIASTEYDPQAWSADSLEGAFVALAGVGLHQVYKQSKKIE